MTHRPRKRFGQNFLHDRHVIDKIVAVIAPARDDHVVEIGPGQGALTRSLVGRCGKLTLIEIDRDLAAALRDDPELGEAELIESDVLRVDLAALGTDLRLVGNLPYNVSTPILFWALDTADHIRDMHFMLQKEVVDRMAAGPGGKEYGRLSVMLQVRCEVQKLFTVPPGAFFPAPKVQSAIVRLIPKRDTGLTPEQMTHLSQIVTRAFGQRRKTIANTLKGMISRDMLAANGIDPGARPEQIAVERYIRLATGQPS